MVCILCSSFSYLILNLVVRWEWIGSESESLVPLISPREKWLIVSPLFDYIIQGCIQRGGQGERRIPAVALLRQTERRDARRTNVLMLKQVHWRNNSLLRIQVTDCTTLIITCLREVFFLNYTLIRYYKCLIFRVKKIWKTYTFPIEWCTKWYSKIATSFSC